jgi:quinoprotein glucose dehydrogenase
MNSSRDLLRVSIKLVFVVLTITAFGASAIAQDWMHYGGDEGGSRFSSLTQINRENVTDLELAWTYRTGAVEANSKLRMFIDFQATPILLPEEAGGHLIVCDPFTKVIALLAQWRDPDAEADAACATRLFLPLPDLRLLAIDARNGDRCSDFGDNGAVDVKPLIEAMEPAEGVIGTQLLSTAVIVSGVVVVTTTSNKFKSASSVNGAIRGFDARNGKLRWTFDPLVRVATDGMEPTPQSVGGGNVWTMMSIDSERDLLFLPTASPAPNFWGVHRPGDNRYANSIVALRGSTGEVVWHFQPGCAPRYLGPGHVVTAHRRGYQARG